MADTRCANPEYQLDVDVMVIEYSLHKTIESTIESVRQQINSINDKKISAGHASEASSKHQETLQLQESTSILLDLFVHNHPKAQLSTGATFNSNLLEFLILLGRCFRNGPQAQAKHIPSSELSSEHRDQQQSGALSTTLIQQLRQERSLNAVLRRNWMDILRGEDRNSFRPYAQHDTDTQLKGTKRKLSDDTDDSRRIKKIHLQPEIDTKQAQQNPFFKYAYLHNERYCPSAVMTLADLIPHFMQLSLDISRVMGDVNPSWIELATQLMFHAGLERLEQIFSDPQIKHSMPDTDTILVWIEECFAWGSTTSLLSTTPIPQLQHQLAIQNINSDPEYLADRLQTETLISAIFNSTIDIQATDDDSILVALSTLSPIKASQQQYEAYTSLRNKHLQTLHDLTHKSRHSALPLIDNNNSNILPSLHSQHPPLLEFLLTLLRYTEMIWTCNYSPDVSGKPVLIQIEEGGLEGMEDEEFLGFLGRCGLKMNRNSVGGADASGGEKKKACQIRWMR